MAEAKPVQPFADRAAMPRHAMPRHAMPRGQFRDDLVQRQVALDRQPVAQPGAAARQLARGTIALRLRQEATVLALEDHHVVHKARRHPKMPRGLPVPMPLLDKRDDPTAKFHRMWPAHSDPLHLARSGSHNPRNLGILNRKGSDMF